MKVFRTLKDLQKIKLSSLKSLREDSKTFKNLILQRTLKKLIVSPLRFPGDENTLASFLALSQVAERRKCWPQLASLGLNFEYSEFQPAGQNLECLLKFLKDLKSCETVFKCSDFQLSLPVSSEEVAIFDEILILRAPFSVISVVNSNLLASLLKKAQNCESLKSFSFWLKDGLSDFPLNEFANLQEIKLRIDHRRLFKGQSHFLLENLGSFKDLRSVSISISGDPNELLKYTFSTLTELTDLNLRFSGMFSWNDYAVEEAEITELNWPWLKQLFHSIGKMKKLKKLSLHFNYFLFENSNSILKSLCQALGNLPQLSSFSLSVEIRGDLNDENIVTFAGYLEKLTMLESLLLHIGNSKFTIITFAKLMESIKSLKILSDLDLEIHCLKTTKKCHEVLYQTIYQMRCLNRMKIEIGIKRGKGKLLHAEIHKRMAGSVASE